ncbi:MAG: transposase [Eubacterium sp.]|nr:transposase [Eubacterium sp.]
MVKHHKHPAIIHDSPLTNPPHKNHIQFPRHPIEPTSSKYFSNNIRKTKTAKVDTYMIAKTLMMQDDLRFVSFFDLDMMDLKALGRFRQKTIKQRTRLKIQLTTYVDQVFPEIQLEKFLQSE